MKTLIFVFLLCSLSFAQTSDIKIKLGEAKTKKSLIAVPPLQYFGTPATGNQYNTFGAEFYTTLINDLAVSSYFQMIPQTAFIEDTSKTSLKPAPGDPKGFNFEAWKQISADFLLRAGFSVSGSSMEIETYLYHVPRAQLVLEGTYKGPIKSARKMAHKYANDVLKALTGIEGMFLSKIVVSSDRGSKRAREVFIMNWDGSDSTQISHHKSIAISPTWSLDGKKIAYTAYVKKRGAKFVNPDMLVRDLDGKKLYIISFRQGLNSGAAFDTSGNHIYLTISQGVNPNIYKIDMSGKIVNKLTDGPSGAMNVEPAICKRDEKIAFSSDRHGRPMIYTMNSDGSNVKRITFAGVFNSSPAWSPDCKRIAFAGQSDDHFDIFVVDADGTNMIRLTSAKKANGRWSSNEDPVFSPDGRFVMYTSNRTGKNQIYISTVDGSEERQITADSYNYYKPRWSENIE